MSGRPHPLLVHSATLGPVGQSPIAPGTAGTFVTAVALWFVHLAPAAYLTATLALSAFGVVASNHAERALGKKDPGSVVIDEAAGMMVSVALLPHTLGIFIAGFALFRVFDILKPPPINALQRLPSGWGIMVDDLMAGVYANLLIRLWLRTF